MAGSRPDADALQISLAMWGMIICAAIKIGMLF
jgi:hypothetical protein